MRQSAAALAVIVLWVAGGCARLVVVDPGVVQERNDSAWKLRQARARQATISSGAPVSVPGGASARDRMDGGGGLTPPSGETPIVTPVSPLPRAAPPVAVSSAPAPEIPKAVLEGPRDGYGIPQGLYPRDPMLGSYLEVMNGRISSYRAAGAGAIALGVVMAGLSAFLFWRASANADAASRASANGETVTNDPSATQYFFGVADGVLALGFLGFGIAQVATGADPSALQRYSHETYGVP